MLPKSVLYTHFSEKRRLIILPKDGITRQALAEHKYERGKGADELMLPENDVCKFVGYLKTKVGSAKLNV